MGDRLQARGVNFAHGRHVFPSVMACVVEWLGELMVQLAIEWLLRPTPSSRFPQR